MRKKSRIVFGLISGVVLSASAASLIFALVTSNLPEIELPAIVSPPKIETINLKDFKINLRTKPNGLDENEDITDEQKQQFYNNFLDEALYSSTLEWEQYLETPKLDPKKFTFDPVAKCYDSDKYIRTIEISVNSIDGNIVFQGGIKSIFFNILIQSKIEEDSKIFDTNNGIITVPANIDAITDNILSNIQHNIKRYEFEDYTNSRLQLINNRAFSNLENLTTLDLSKHTNLKVIKNGVFVNMPNIKEILLPNTIEYFQYGFSNCNSLLTFKIPNNWKKIKKNYFRNCELLWSKTKCIIPENIVEIEPNSFETNNFVKGIYFPDKFPKEPHFYETLGIKDLTQVYVGNQPLV